MAIMNDTTKYARERGTDGTSAEKLLHRLRTKYKPSPDLQPSV